jgi:CheY-like chemotaxis protein
MSPALAPILIVDDDHDLRSGLAACLEEEGHKVVEARHGREALDLLKNGLRPVLILLDLSMPVMDGETFCQSLRQEESIAQQSIVIMSADLAAEEKSKRCGANGLIKKPVQLEILLAMLARWLP